MIKSKGRYGKDKAGNKMFAARPNSGRTIANDIARYIGEPKIPAGIAVGQALVIQAQEVQDGCMAR
jgi:hypothetical protein